MTTYAAAIAARLQRGREDEDMGKDESVWDDDPPVTQSTVVSFAEAVARELDRLTMNEGTLQLRVAELERANEDLSDRNARQERELGLQVERADELERQVKILSASRAELEQELTQERERAFGFASNHADCYVAREVPWTDVAAGMMTIARDGTPWMVQANDVPCMTLLRNGEQTFTKTPKDGETVRVLVPYVTGEQAEGLVSSVLGGTEVGS